MSRQDCKFGLHGSGALLKGEGQVGEGQVGEGLVLIFETAEVVQP